MVQVAAETQSSHKTNSIIKSQCIYDL